MAMAVAFLLPPRPAGALSPPPASARPAQKHRAVGSRQGCVALAACGVGLALAAGQRCSGNSRGPAVRPWQLQAKAKKDDPKSHDGLVALGGILQAATDAYKASVQEQVDSEKRLRAEMEEKVEKLHADACQAFAQEQVDSEKRLEEKIEKNTVSVDGNDLKLDSGFVLSKLKSSRKRLVWEKGEQSVEWLYEMGDSWNVELFLDFGSWLHSKDRFSYKNYNFSIANCEARLVFMLSGDLKHVGAFFGFPKNAKCSQPNHCWYLDAITCRVRVDLLDPKGNTWLNLFRTGVKRYEPGGAYGEYVITAARLRKILPKEADGSARIRVAIADVGPVELSDIDMSCIRESFVVDDDPQLAVWLRNLADNLGTERLSSSS